jgi:hypothetical protein
MPLLSRDQLFWMCCFGEGDLHFTRGDKDSRETGQYSRPLKIFAPFYDLPVTIGVLYYPFLMSPNHFMNKGEWK